jgi:hypothetical protein
MNLSLLGYIPGPPISIQSTNDELNPQAAELLSTTLPASTDAIDVPHFDEIPRLELITADQMSGHFNPSLLP